MASEEPNYQPTCEDYHSDESDGRVLESFTGRKSPAAANVSTKRSHPSDLDKEKPPAQERVSANIDLRSDSGYSSYTAATVSSADSAPSATSRRSPPVAPATTAPLPSQSPAPKPRRPTVSDQRQQSNNSPRPKPLSRTASQSSRRPPGAPRRPTITHDRRDSREDDCVDPNCTKCGPNALPQLRRPNFPPSHSARDVSIPSDQRSMRSDPTAYYASPPSPTYTRQSTYMQGPAVIQPAPPRRRSSSTTRPQRPMSYSGGDPGAQYWVPGMPAPYPSPPQERGPPPSSSAYRNMQQYPQMPQVAPYIAPHAQRNGYYPPQYPPNQTSPPYDLQQKRPDLSTRNSSYYGTRNQPAPIITQERREPPKYSARYAQPQSATQTKFPTLQLQDEAYESSETESSSEEEYEPDPRNARALMPPPKIKRSKSSSKKQRPNLRHANTTQAVDRLERRSSIVVPERPKDRDRASRTSNASTRGVSVSRPAAPERQTQSAYDTRTARVMVNNTKASRRQSTQMYDKMYEQYAQAKAIEERYAKAKALEEEMAQARVLEQAKARALEEQYKAEQKRQRRSSRVYYPPEEFDDDDEEEEEEEEERPAPLRNGRRRPTDVDSRKGKERIVETKNKRTELAAEDYISAQRGSQNPYADQIHKAAKRASRVPSGPSDSGSSRSKGSDKQSQSARTVATSNGGNEIRLRVDASAPLSLSFNGDMEGRTLQFTPAENGMADIVIGNSRGGESTYRASERGSVLGSSSKKSLVTSQARRDAEEMTERSSRSGRSRREGREREIRDDRNGPRHVLRRSTDYRN